MTKNTLYKRFIKYTTKSPNGCIIWTGAFATIPVIRSMNKTISVRHYIYELTFPYKIIDGHIKSSCNNKKCVNPEHLMNRGEFFNSLILKNPENECWEWKGSFRNEYGVFNFGNGDEAVHRKMYQRYKGSIPEGYYVCHSCDNTKCINPQHLWAGTQTDNMKDMYEKKRGRHPSGEKHHRAKITEEQVRTIKTKHLEGFNMREIQRILDIPYKTIQHICSGNSWKHVKI